MDDLLFAEEVDAIELHRAPAHDEEAMHRRPFEEQILAPDQGLEDGKLRDLREDFEIGLGCVSCQPGQIDRMKVWTASPPIHALMPNQPHATSARSSSCCARLMRACGGISKARSSSRPRNS